MNKSEIIKLFSDNFKALRNSAGLTQTDIAREFGISPQSVQRWESGESMPRPTRLRQLAEILHCELDDISPIRYSVLDRPNVAHVYKKSDGCMVAFTEKEQEHMGEVSHNLPEYEYMGKYRQCYW